MLSGIALQQILAPLRLTEIIDIGANPIDGTPPYQAMLANRLARVTGFEPQADALAKLIAQKSDLETYLPHAVGDGASHTLFICFESGMTSLLRPDEAMLEIFNVFPLSGKIISEVPVQTMRLDDIPEVEIIDYLKIDIQGGELAVFQNGRAKLAAAVAVQVEVSFVPLYRNQPCLGEIDLELRSYGFLPHCVAEWKKWPIAPCVVDDNPYMPLNQVLEADLVYVRDFTRPDAMSDEQLKHLALIAHCCYGSYDLALWCVVALERRDAVPEGSERRYLECLAL